MIVERKQQFKNNNLKNYIKLLTLFREFLKQVIYKYINRCFDILSRYDKNFICFKERF